MTAKEYAEYEKDVSDFLATMDGEPSSGFWECPACGADPFNNCDGCTNPECKAYGDPDGARYWGDEEFSSRPCDCCGAHLAGSRHSYIGWTKGARAAGFPESHRWEGKVCSNCVYYLEYGQLDDMTMLDIERDREEQHAEWIESRFTLYGALYVLCSQYHSGQSSRGYRILSRLVTAGYSPGLSIQHGEFEDDFQRELYNELRERYADSL